MTDYPFRLATVSAAGSPPFAVLTLDGAHAIAVAAAHAAWRDARPAARERLSEAVRLQAMLDDWERNLAALVEVAAFAREEGAASDRWNGGAAPLADLRVHAPIGRPGKMLYAAANQPGHISEMIARDASLSEEDRARAADRDKDRVRPYAFLKAPSAIVGPYDDIVLPPDVTQLDWEVELAAVIGRPAKAVPAERALDHVAGYMTTNDVTARDGQGRPDWPRFRIDWFTGKSHDTFAPMGPYFVPAAFVADYGALRLTLKVNGETRQDGTTGAMVFSVEEQIAHGARTIGFAPGDVISAGTPAGVGHASGTYLAPGDVVEAEVATLGAQRNTVVAQKDRAPADPAG